MYLNKQNMLKPFSQIPIYSEDATVKIPINDFIELQEFLKVFNAPFLIIQNAYYNAIKDSTITFKYLEEDGSEITENEARDRIKQYSEQ